MRFTASFFAAILLCAATYAALPFTSRARAQYRDDDYRYFITQDTAALNTEQQQLDAQATALAARKKQLDQQRTAQEKLAAQLSAIAEQLEAQRRALEARTQQLAQQKADQDQRAQQLASQQQTSTAYIVKDDNFNGINDIIENLARTAL